MKVSGYLVPVLVAFMAVSSAMTSCEDKTGPCDAVITVTDSLGKRIPGAIVTLRPDSSVYAPGSPQLDTSITKTDITDALGQAAFSYKLEAVLIIDANKGLQTGRDYIRLESASSVAKTVVIR